MSQTKTKNRRQAIVLSSLTALNLLLAGCASLSSESSVPADNLPPAPSAANAAAGPVRPNIQYQNLWDRIRAGLSLPVLDSPYIERHERWFANNPEFMEAMVGRARLYLYYIVEEVEKRGMPMEIALLPAIESAYKPHAYSRAKASGLWQFIPSTGRLYGLHANWWYDGRRDVMASTQAALDYLEKLKADFNGDWQLALASYNCGEGKVARLMEANRRKGLPTNYSALKTLPRETQHYIPRLMAFVNIVSDPAKYGVQLAQIPNQPYFERVDAGTQVDLGVVAKITEMPVTELYQINPGHSRWMTGPDGPHHLLVPADKKDILLAGLSNLKDEDRMQWTRHEVKRGDTLSEISRQYHVPVEVIKSSNNLASNLLRIGQDLLIPVAQAKITLASAPATPPAQIAKRAANPSASGVDKVQIIYQVRGGDTLSSIARRYNVTVAQLRDWNRLPDKDDIKRGQKLTIWTHPAKVSGLPIQPPG